MTILDSRLLGKCRKPREEERANLIASLQAQTEQALFWIKSVKYSNRQGS